MLGKEDGRKRGKEIKRMGEKVEFCGSDRHEPLQIHESMVVCYKCVEMEV